MQIELRPAYAWDCEECGREQFSRCIVPELNAEEIEELKQEHGIERWELGEFQMMPTTVNCKDCGAVFDSMPA